MKIEEVLEAQEQSNMKYDCNKTMVYFHELKRLCDSYDDYGCRWCPLYNQKEQYCEDASLGGKSSIEKVQKWSDENPE